MFKIVTFVRTKPPYNDRSNSPCFQRQHLWATMLFFILNERNEFKCPSNVAIFKIRIIRHSQNAEQCGACERVFPLWFCKFQQKFMYIYKF